MSSLEPDATQRVTAIIATRHRHLVSQKAEKAAVALLTDLWAACEEHDISDVILQQVCSLPALCVDAVLAAERQRLIRGWPGERVWIKS